MVVDGEYVLLLFLLGSHVLSGWKLCKLCDGLLLPTLQITNLFSKCGSCGRSLGGSLTWSWHIRSCGLELLDVLKGPGSLGSCLRHSAWNWCGGSSCGA
ncbi:hypothetical protein FB45DRAFT_910562 [Roridomyces roridus]|uniref:Uncharacterized protein n=1 Tax=Roridomyces roridus TaxID=1738132 RepID=A0AAD7BZI2_9AGAR|nr:hypothetical protein FB45DRAFT_910562 [Roridomyces roridus]